jgi:hypothetical protein
MKQAIQIPKFPKKDWSRHIRQNDKKVCIEVYQAELYSDDKWLLQIVDERGNTTCWRTPFRTSQEAMNKGLRVLEEEGIDEFILSQEDF